MLPRKANQSFAQPFWLCAKLGIVMNNHKPITSTRTPGKTLSLCLFGALVSLGMPEVANAACTTTRCNELSKNVARGNMEDILDDWDGNCTRNFVDTFKFQRRPSVAGIIPRFHGGEHHQASDRGEVFNGEVRLFLTHDEKEGHIQMFRAEGSDVGTAGRIKNRSGGAMEFLDNFKFDSPSVPHPADMGVIQLTPETTGGNAAGLVAVVSKDVHNAVDFFSYDFNDTALIHRGGFAKDLGIDSDETETAAMTYHNGEVLLFIGSFSKKNGSNTCGQGKYKIYTADPMELFPNLASIKNPLAEVNLEAFDPGTIVRDQRLPIGHCIGPGTRGNGSSKNQTAFGEAASFIHAADGLYLVGAQSDGDGNNDQIAAYEVSNNSNGTYSLTYFTGNYNATNADANGHNGAYLYVKKDGVVIHGGTERYAKDRSASKGYTSRWHECTGN